MSLFLVLVLAPLRALGSWLLAPGFFFSSRRLPSTHSTSFCATRYDTTRQDTVKTSSSRLLPCCTPFPSSPPLLSFVLLSLPCYFLVSFSGPTSARPNIVSGDPSRRKLSLLITPCSVSPGNTTTASRSRKSTPPSINRNSTSPQSIPTRVLSPPPGTPPGSNPVRFAREATSFLSVPSLCVLLQSISCIGFTSPVASPSRPSAWPVCLSPRIFSNQSVHPTPICPLRAPERTYHCCQFHHQRPSLSCSDLIKPTTTLLIQQRLLMSSS